jgi:hypothetical protein
VTEDTMIGRLSGLRCVRHQQHSRGHLCVDAEGRITTVLNVPSECFLSFSTLLADIDEMT